MDKNTKYRLEQKFQLKQDRKECPRMTKEEKENLLALLDGDSQSVEVGKIMIEKYLKLYPAEKKFAKRYKQKLSSMLWRNGFPYIKDFNKAINII